MATVCVTVPDDQAMRIVNAFSETERQDYQTIEEGIAIVQEAVFRFMADTTRKHEARLAADAVMNNPNDPLVDAMVTQG